MVCTHALCSLANFENLTMRNLGGSSSQGYMYLNIDVGLSLVEVPSIIHIVHLFCGEFIEAIIVTPYPSVRCNMIP